MVDATFLKDSISRLLFSITIVLLFYPLVGQSAVFNVTNEDELRDALSTAESNGEDDVINIATGTYNTGGATITYESSEDFSLTLMGEGANSTILDGGQMDRVLEINSVSESDALISISDLTIQNGFHISTPADTSKSDGGGIYAVSPNLTIEDCEFLSNSESRAGNGGGLFANVQNTLNLSGNLFSQNSAAFSGGGAYVSANELILYDNEFIINTSVLGDGGGLAINSNTMHLSATGSCDASITNNIFISNESGEISHMGSGGGLGISLYCNNYDFNIINNTFTLNHAYKDGGGLSFSAIADNIDFVIQSFVTNLYNNIIYDNFATGNGSDIYLSLVADSAHDNVNISYNDFSDYCNFYNYQFCTQDSKEAKNNINADPLFEDAEAGDVSLQPESPCIDVGDPNAPDVPDTDILGNPRVPPPDMGAFEYLQIADGHGGQGGCSIVNNPDESSLAAFFAIPILILTRRIIKRYKC